MENDRQISKVSAASSDTLSQHSTAASSATAASQPGEKQQQQRNWRTRVAGFRPSWPFGGEKVKELGEKDGLEKPEPRPRKWYCLKRVWIPVAAFFVILLIVLATVLTLRHKSNQSSRLSDKSFARNAVVDVGHGKYRGMPLESGTTQWLGMRYSAPPVGELRFAAPQPPKNFSGVRNAHFPKRGCIGVGPNFGRVSEDCLSMDIYAPSDATPDSALPVFVFIQGGGFGSATAHFNASGLISNSGGGMVVAMMTYRVGAFGFLASEEVQKDGILNAGLRDQRFAMQWVKDHITSFGGDPDKITLGGQSAGAGSVLNHLTAFGGRDDKLFRAAALQSQSMPPILTVNGSQFQYDRLTRDTGCDQEKGNTLDCLRKLPFHYLLSKVSRFPYPDGPGGAPVFAWNPVVDGDFVQDIPVAAVRKGKFLKNVPVIFGDVLNEGTIFTNPHPTNQDEAETFIRNTFPNFNDTGMKVVGELYDFASKDDPSSYWRRPSQAYGETRYTCPGQHLCDMFAAQSGKPVYNYMFAAGVDGRGPNGVAHGADLPALWGGALDGDSGRHSGDDGPGGAPGPARRDTLPLHRRQQHRQQKRLRPRAYGGAAQVGAAFFERGADAAEREDVTRTFQGYWASFIVSGGDPNQNRFEAAPAWEEWGKSRRRLRIEEEDRTAMEEIDADEQKRCRFLSGISEELLQ